VTPASVNIRRGKVGGRFEQMKKIYADGDYRGKPEENVKSMINRIYSQ
jgi:hypothetical protein